MNKKILNLTKTKMNIIFHHRQKSTHKERQNKTLYNKHDNYCMMIFLTVTMIQKQVNILQKKNNYLSNKKYKNLNSQF